MPQTNDSNLIFYHNGYDYSRAKTEMKLPENIIPNFNNNNLEK